jgi:dienelactone hydrolase
MLPGVLLAVAAGAGNRPRFAELRVPPDGARTVLTVPGLEPGPEGNSPAPAAARARWRRARPVLLARWEAVLGPLPPRPDAQREPATEVAREDAGDHTRVLLRYPDERGRPIEAYLLLPRGAARTRARRFPGIVVLHQTTSESHREPAGLHGREPMHLAVHLVRRGYACLAPRNVLWSRPGTGYQEVTDDLLRPARPGEWVWRTGMAKMLWDALRATDVLAARPEVDARRLGSIGHSLGGKEVLYHAAFDARLRAAVSCEGGVGLAFSNWDADWYLGPQARSMAPALDHQTLLALAAPRALLLIGGESADGAQSWPYVAAALPAWRAHGAEERLGLLRHAFGHDFPPPGPVREQIYTWLDHWMRHRPAAARASR